MFDVQCSTFDVRGSDHADEEAQAVACGNLGLIHQTRGELDKAEQMHRKSLEINERLGRQEGIANACGNLGLICQTRGEPDEARDLWTKSRDLYVKIGAKHMAEAVQGWLDELGPPEGGHPSP